MSSSGRQQPARRHQPGLKLLALVLLAVALAPPINDLFRYAILVIGAVAIAGGNVIGMGRSWLTVLAAVGVCLMAQIWLPAPRIEEGHNVFIVDRPGSP